MDMSLIEDRKTRARAWFEALRNDICAAFERLEDDAPASLYPGDAGRFVRTPWERTEHPGETGKAYWRTRTFNNIRVRMVEYTPGYLADHWCDRGHVLYVVEGELDTELRDGRKFKLLPGMSYQVSDHGDAAHRSSTKVGAKIFIVD